MPKPNAIKDNQFNAEHNGFESSPEIAAPELHAEIFNSPARRRRVPGVSVLTPAKGRKEGSVMGTMSVKGSKMTPKAKAVLWDSDSDEDGAVAGMSPPKTILIDVPEARLVRTPGMWI